jgi:NADPH-dependent 2,4-dienoyl-CoA reductase/sulfur reductase-like enzyme
MNDGAEVAAALTMNGQRVTMIFPQDGIGANIFPWDLSCILNDFYRERGVEVLSNESVCNLERQGSHTVLTLESGRTLVVDGVVAGVGIEPNTAMAQEAGLLVTNGIWVNESLQTSRTDIYAAGDVANFFSPALERRVRVEHEDNANTMGSMVGRAMAGAPVAYHHLPFFYSDLFDLSYEAVGLLNSKMEIVTDWQEPNQKGVIYYLEKGRVRGVLLWNVWGQVESARALIMQPEPLHRQMLEGRLPQEMQAEA